jgi:diacylglycerol kinase (ATP)
MPHFRIIANPMSRRGTAAHLIPEIEQRLKHHKIEYDLVLTNGPWNAVELARQAVAQGVKVVVAAGGDGTAQEVLNGLMEAKQSGLGQVTLGVIPIGRGNDFSFSMGAPATMEESIAALAAGKTHRIDVGTVAGGDMPPSRYFGNGVGIGFDAVVGFQSLQVPQLSGFLSYLLAVIKTMMLYFHAPLVEIELDHETISQPALMVSVMNGRRLGGGFMMAPTSKNNDGLFDLTIAGQMSRMEILKLIPRFIKGTQAGHPAIRQVQSKHVRVTTLNGKLPSHGDGETLTMEGRQLTMDVVPNAIDLIVAPTEAAA